MLGDSGQDVDGEPVRVRVVDGDELNPAFHQVRDEREVAAEPVHLRDDQDGLQLLRQLDCLGQLRTVIALAGLDLGELRLERPGASVQIVGDGISLRVEAESRPALLLGGDAVVGDVPTGGHDLCSMSVCEILIRRYWNFTKAYFWAFLRVANASDRWRGMDETQAAPLALRKNQNRGFGARARRGLGVLVMMSSALAIVLRT